MSAVGSHGERKRRVVLAHGGGGELMHRLIRDHIAGPLSNEYLAPLTDGAVLPASDGSLVFTTDSYVVTPLEFGGGDIGRLAVAGTVNDLAVMGAEPLALSLGLILEEGLSFEVLDRVLGSIRATADEAGVPVVTGDTKVIERRAPAAEQDYAAHDEMFINTAGLGRLHPGVRLGIDRVKVGDVIVVNGPIAEHGLAVMSRRRGIEFETTIQSDAAPLNGLIGAVLDTGADVKFLRDATRGGLAGVLADVSEGSGLSVEVDEAKIPITPAVRHAAEMLGLDPLTVANEGKVVGVLAPEAAEEVLGVWRKDPLGRHADCIGRVTNGHPPLVVLRTRAGGQRIVQRPYGEELPRIC